MVFWTVIFVLGSYSIIKKDVGPEQRRLAYVFFIATLAVIFWIILKA